MDEKFKEAVDHLARVISLSQIPRDHWSPDDRKLLQEARKFLEEQRPDSKQ